MWFSDLFCAEKHCYLEHKLVPSVDPQFPGGNFSVSLTQSKPALHVFEGESGVAALSLQASFQNVFLLPIVSSYSHYGYTQWPIYDNGLCSPPVLVKEQSVS